MSLSFVMPLFTAPVFTVQRHELLSDCLLHNPVFDRGNPQIVIPFNAKITGQSDIKNYGEYLYDNAGESILAWVIEGAKASFAASRLTGIRFFAASYA